MEIHSASGGEVLPRAYHDPHGSIPDYLESFVVDQDLARYTPRDQAVWRFVLLQLADRLQHSAHPSYARGLRESGISLERIPSIEQMNRSLSAFGWRAVCVDGFIPPRAFQAFQARGILPIAAEIRSAEQLPYTPAPDIIHEAAGHAPILIDERYASYLRASGEVASRAFSSPADARVDRAVRALSELEERLDADPREVELADRELGRAVAELGEPSEAARMSRLYWWTAEYGLVGTPRAYRLYGAGLLSSLGESHFCHDPQVQKLRLSAACTRVGYDITKPQPQLFVADDFDHLHAVLDEVRQTLAHHVGGLRAVRSAAESGELCTIDLPHRLQVIGTLASVEDRGSGQLLSFSPGAALVARGRMAARVSSPCTVVVGALADGTDPYRFAHDGFGADGRVELSYASGARVEGLLAAAHPGARPGIAWLARGRITWPGSAPREFVAPFPLLLAGRLGTASAGSACAEVPPLEGAASRRSAEPRPRVPRPRPPDPKLSRLNQLYSAVFEASRHAAADPSRLSDVARELDRAYPHEWLLRWNMLEALTAAGLAESALGRELEQRLHQLEIHYRGRHPIELGVRYLTARRPVRMSKEGQP